MGQTGCRYHWRRYYLQNWRYTQPWPPCSDGPKDLADMESSGLPRGRSWSAPSHEQSRTEPETGRLGAATVGYGDKQKEKWVWLREMQILAPHEGEHFNSQAAPQCNELTESQFSGSGGGWQAQLCHLLALWSWASPITSIGLSFPACKMGVIMVLL